MRLQACVALASLALLSGCTDPAPDDGDPTVVHQVSIHGMQYDPRTLDMPQGHTLRFENHETVAHTATAMASPMGNLDSGDIAPDGGGHEFPDMVPGTYTFTCKHHAAMRVTVTVAAP